MFLEDNILILQLSYRKFFPPVQDDPYAYGSVIEEACQRSLQMKKIGNIILATTSDCRSRKRALAAARNKETLHWKKTIFHSSPKFWSSHTMLQKKITIVMRTFQI